MLIQLDDQTPREIAEATLTWVDMWGFWVAVLGAVASTLVAVAAVWVSLSTRRESKRAQLRAERAEWVRPYSDYLNGWVRHIAPSASVRARYRDWYLDYDVLLAQAAVLQNEGADNLLRQAQEAIGLIHGIKRPAQHEAAESARKKLIEWARDWVKDPEAGSGRIADHVSAPQPPVATL